MTARRARWAAAACAVAAAACGHKNNPQPPLRPIPVPVATWSIERDGAAIRLQITVPDANVDRSRPPAVDRVEVYCLTKPAGDPAPGSADLVVNANLIGTIPVRPAEPPKPKEKPTPGAPADLRPAPGDITTFADPSPPGPSGSIRYYATVAAVGRRRSHTSTILQVPLADSPGAPANVTIDYTAERLTLKWDADPAAHYVVEATDDRGGSAKRLTAAPQAAGSYEEPVEFGKNRCLTVRMADVKGAVTILGVPSQPACTTPRDRFPPPVPTDLRGAATDSGIDLVWTGVQAADLAGYIVLRSDSPDGTLQRLTPEPLTASSYLDTGVRSGATYWYAVASVDKATPPNVSAPSARYSVQARTQTTSGVVSMKRETRVSKK